MELRTNQQWLADIPAAEDAPPRIARWTEALRDLLASADLDALDASGLDLLERSALALVGAVHTERLRRQGWQVRDWYAAAPPALAEPPAGWRDHPYVLLQREREAMLFCSEPYELRGADLRALAKLVGAGWDVHVDAGSAVQFPGRTLRVSLSRARRAGAEEGQRWDWAAPSAEGRQA